MKPLFWVFLALLLTTFYHRVNHYDEAWLAEQAYWLVHDGVVRSELFRGLNGWEKQLFVFHKGFVYLSAVWEAVFGFSLVAGKLFSLVWAVLGGLLLWGYLRQQRIDNQYIWLGLLLFVANGIVIEFSFVYRPEAMCVALGFASFWLLTNQRWMWAGLLAGLAVLTHLNGLCFVLAGGGWLLWYRQPARVVVFGFAAVLVASCYLLDIALANGWTMLSYQLPHDPSVAHIRSWADKFFVMVHAARLLRLTAELPFLVGSVYLLARQKSVDKPLAQPVGRYLAFLVGVYLCLSRGHGTHYVLLFVPFICAYVALSIAEWQRSHPTIGTVRCWHVVLTVYLLSGTYRAGLLLQSNLSSPGVTVLNAHMAALIGHPNGNVLAPLDFFYEQIGHYQIRCIDRFQGRFFASYENGNLTSKQLFAMAKRERFVAVITYDGKGPAAPLADTHPLTDSLNHIGCYHRVYQDRWNSLYLPDRAIK